MRSDAPGFVLDASALAALPRSAYAQALVRVYTELDRPIVIPACALVAACVTGRIRPAQFDPPEFSVTALNQAVVPAVAKVIADATSALSIDTAHAVYEAASTGFPVVTANSDAYAGLTITVDIEELP